MFRNPDKETLEELADLIVEMLESRKPPEGREANKTRAIAIVSAVVVVEVFSMFGGGAHTYVTITKAAEKECEKKLKKEQEEPYDWFMRLGGIQDD